MWHAPLPRDERARRAFFVLSEAFLYALCGSLCLPLCSVFKLPLCRPPNPRNQQASHSPSSTHPFGLRRRAAALPRDGRARRAVAFLCAVSFPSASSVNGSRCRLHASATSLPPSLHPLKIPQSGPPLLECGSKLPLCRPPNPRNQQASHSPSSTHPFGLRRRAAALPRDGRARRAVAVVLASARRPSAASS
jgi:hypothetical protein